MIRPINHRLIPVGLDFTHRRSQHFGEQKVHFFRR